MIGKRRVLIATIGSLGDLHPRTALALGLRQRGHQVTIAYSEPNTKSFHLGAVEGGRLFRKLLLPELRGTYEDLLAAAVDADLLVAGELVFAAPLCRGPRQA